MNCNNFFTINQIYSYGSNSEWYSAFGDRTAAPKSPAENESHSNPLLVSAGHLLPEPPTPHDSLLLSWPVPYEFRSAFRTFRLWLPVPKPAHPAALCAACLHCPAACIVWPLPAATLFSTADLSSSIDTAILRLLSCLWGIILP